MAVATKPILDVKKFSAIKARIADVFKNHGPDIKKNTPVATPMGVFAEMDWLAKQIDRLTGLTSEPEEPAPQDSDETG
jgi:hypothetical protein